MKYRTLGTSGIKVSELGYGCSGLFGKNILPLKPAISDEQAISIVRSAIESGINFFDTGINYGFAEERLGRCLKELSTTESRSNLLIETKFGEVLDEDGNLTGEYSYKPDWIKRSVELQLKRLQTDYIDLYATHGGQISDFSDEMLKCLDDLKRQGVIRAYGANTFDTEVLEWICQERNYDYVMLDYNIMRQDREDLIHRLYSNGIGVLGGGLSRRTYSQKGYIKLIV